MPYPDSLNGKMQILGGSQVFIEIKITFFEIYL